ncbi:MAG TPA: glycosyltransferase family 4 protein, partial [Anaerolineae bacterium]
MPISQSGYFHYQQLVQQIEQLISQILPSTATVLVVSKGDDDLLRLGGRTGWHFPQSEDGLYAGYYPRDSQAAITHLEALRGRGGQYLVFPATAFWWLDHYVHFCWHLDRRYQCICRDDCCIVYRLAKQGRLLSWYNQIKHQHSQPVQQRLQPAPAGLSDSLQKRTVPVSQLVQALMSYIAGKERPAQKASTPAPARLPVPAGHLRFALDYPETLPLCPPATPFDPRQMDLHWVIPDFVPGMGGPMAIFRFIKFLEAFGHRNTIWIRAGTRHGTAEAARRVIQDAFVPIAAPVRLLQNNMDEIRGDAVIATHAWTAYPVRAVTQVRERFYFVQDFEPLFYPMGSEYLLVEATYRFGFRCLTSSKWLQNLMRSRYQVEAEHFVYAYDPGIYHEKAQVQRGNDRVAFYSRTKTPRRAVEIGLLALEIVAKRHPSLVVDFFGGTMGKISVPYEYYDHGVLSDYQLAQLYCQATIGVVFSTTNYSLIPHEMMGCGLPVVELYTESTAMDFPHDAVTLSEPTPQAIAADIERLLNDKNLREQQAARAKNYVEQLSWEKSARQIESALVAGILARTQGPETAPAAKDSSVTTFTTQA